MSYPGKTEFSWAPESDSLDLRWTVPHGYNHTFDVVEGYIPKPEGWLHPAVRDKSHSQPSPPSLAWIEGASAMSFMRLLPRAPPAGSEQHLAHHALGRRGVSRVVIDMEAGSCDDSRGSFHSAFSSL